MESEIGFLKQFVRGLQTYGTAVKFMVEKKLWVYFAYPILVAILLLYGTFSASSGLADILEAYLSDFFAAYATTDIEFLSTIIAGASTVIAFAFKMLVFFLVSMLSKYFVLIIMSPMMALLSERTEEIITGNVQDFSLPRFFKDILRGVLIALRNLFLETAIIIVCFLLSFIPLVAIITTPLVFITGWYFYGFSMIDYSSERHRLSLKESTAFVRENKGIAIGNGLIFSMLFHIPFVGVVLSSVLAPIAATLAVLEVKR